MNAAINHDRQFTTITRPPEFDARVMAYMPGLSNLARKLGLRGDDAKELVHDTLVYALSHWQNYREDGGMWNWLYWGMRGVLSNRNGKRRVHVIHGDGAERLAALASVPPSQEDYTDLSSVLGRITGRSGGVLMRRVMGDTLQEVAADMGISRQRVQQLEVAGRALVTSSGAAHA